MSFETDKQFCQGEAKTDEDNAVRFFFFKNSFCVFMGLCLCAYVPCLCSCLRSSEEDVRSLGAGVTGCSEQLNLETETEYSRRTRSDLHP